MRRIVTCAAAVLLGVALVAESSVPPAGPGTETAVLADAVTPVASKRPSFVIASLNALGDSHTRRGGHAAFMASGVTRTRHAVSLLRQHGIDVVGLQEMQPAQHREFRRSAGSQFAMFPGPGRRPKNHNTIAWRTSTFDFVSGRLARITYMNGRKAPMPVVRLRHRASGQHIYVVSVHNAPGLSPSAQRLRNQALNQEVALTKHLLRQGVPVFLTGDMNDRERFFCPYTKRTPMKAAAGGSNRGRCQPPPGRIARVDWVFGSRDVQFSRYRFIKSPLVRRTTDHPLVLARATLRG